MVLELGWGQNPSTCAIHSTRKERKVPDTDAGGRDAWRRRWRPLLLRWPRRGEDGQPMQLSGARSGLHLGPSDTGVSGFRPLELGGRNPLPSKATDLQELLLQPRETKAGPRAGSLPVWVFSCPKPRGEEIVISLWSRCLCQSMDHLSAGHFGLFNFVDLCLCQSLCRCYIVIHDSLYVTLCSWWQRHAAPLKNRSDATFHFILPFQTCFCYSRCFAFLFGAEN